MENSEIEALIRLLVKAGIFEITELEKNPNDTENRKPIPLLSFYTEKDRN